MTTPPPAQASTAEVLADLELENQRVFVRTDLDAPVDRSGNVTDTSRIEAAVPTIRALAAAGARVIVGSRFGEFKAPGSGDEGPDAPSIEPAAFALAEQLGMEVLLPDGCTGDSVKRVVTQLREGQVCVLENLAREYDLTSGREALARQLLDHVDVFMADSLRALALESATTTVLPRLLHSRAPGLALHAELERIQRIRSFGDQPRLLIWGGNALSPRLPLLHQLLDERTTVFLVGVAANTHVCAQGGQLGRSSVERSYLAGARTLAEQLGPRLKTQVDVLSAESPRAGTPQVSGAGDVPEGHLALDIGPETQRLLQQEIERAGLVLWCGAPGLYREEAFAGGTRALTEALASAEAFTAVVGDDTVTAARSVAKDATKRIDYVAEGGDAALALLRDIKLPGLLALRGLGT